MKASSILTLQMKIRRESLFLENFDSFLKRTRLMFSPNGVHDSCFQRHEYLVFSAECSQKNTRDWMPGVKNSLCKSGVDCLSGNPSSRYSRKVTSKLRNCCPSMTGMAKQSHATQYLGTPTTKMAWNLFQNNKVPV
ncbi:hypothetical protein TNCV_397221 [Trichonephila clavipes]|nr:hypothetical protein TNCV_397221 [Trichonephila clavipes]